MVQVREACQLELAWSTAEPPEATAATFPLALDLGMPDLHRMFPLSFFSGKVRKGSLPVFNGSPGPEAPQLKRLLLPQGELAAFYNSDDGIRYIAFIELRAGTARGNHYHKVKMEYIYLLSGTVSLYLEDLESKSEQVVPLNAGDLVLIAPGVAHTLAVEKSGEAIEFSPAQFDPNDTYRHVIARSIPPNSHAA